MARVPLGTRPDADVPVQFRESSFLAVCPAALVSGHFLARSRVPSAPRRLPRVPSRVSLSPGVSILLPVRVGSSALLGSGLIGKWRFMFLLETHNDRSFSRNQVSSDRVQGVHTIRAIRGLFLAESQLPSRRSRHSKVLAERNRRRVSICYRRGR